LHTQQRTLARRNGMRLRVDKVTADGKNALCTCYYESGSFWRTAPVHYEVVDLAHDALKDLLRFGMRPMVSVVCGVPKSLANMDAADPFELLKAIRVAGLEHLFIPDAPIAVASSAKAPVEQERVVVDAQLQLQEAA